MKDKIFQRLKTVYSHLGLGDDVLALQAQTLSDLGLVTEDNIETVVAAQKSFLEGLQRAADKRATDAATKAKAELAKQHEEELKKKAEEEAQKKAAEEAAKAAAEAEAKKKADEEAQRKAAEEAERKRQEEMQKAEMPESVRKILEEFTANAAQKDKEYADTIAKLTNASNDMKALFEKQLKELTDGNASLKKEYDALKKENEEKRKADAARARQDMILAKARELNIPQSRIDEGFVIKDDADEAAITEYLSTVAKNVRANALPDRRTPFSIDSNKEVGKEEMAEIAKSLVR